MQQLRSGQSRRRAGYSTQHDDSTHLVATDTPREDGFSAVSEKINAPTRPAPPRIDGYGQSHTPARPAAMNPAATINVANSRGELPFRPIRFQNRRRTHCHKLPILMRPADVRPGPHRDHTATPFRGSYVVGGIGERRASAWLRPLCFSGPGTAAVLAASRRGLPSDGSTRFEARRTPAASANRGTCTVSTIQRA